MKTILLAAGAVAVALTAGSVLAATKHSAATVASPKQPIPYAELNDYLKASPAQRAKKDWWSGQAVASTGASANTSATTPAPTAASPDAAAPAATPDATPSTPAPTSTPPSLGGGTVPPSAASPLPAAPPTATPSTGEVNPPTAIPPK